MNTNNKNQASPLKMIKAGLIGLIPLALILIYYHFSDNTKTELKLLREEGIVLESEVILRVEGKAGHRVPKNGYWHRCQYFIGDTTYYYYIFTSIKPLPLGEKILIHYYQFEDGKNKGKTLVGSTEEMKFKYKEYGFGDLF